MHAAEGKGTACLAHSAPCLGDNSWIEKQIFIGMFISSVPVLAGNPGSFYIFLSLYVCTQKNALCELGIKGSWKPVGLFLIFSVHLYSKEFLACFVVPRSSTPRGTCPPLTFHLLWGHPQHCVVSLGSFQALARFTLSLCCSGWTLLINLQSLWVLFLYEG